jgi:hypothetical protein
MNIYIYKYTEDALRLALVHVRHHHSRQLTDGLVELRQSLFVAAQRVERPAQVVVDLSPEDTLHKKKNLKSQCPSILAIRKPTLKRTFESGCRDTLTKILKPQCPSVLPIEHSLYRGLLKVEACTLTQILKPQCPCACTIEHALYRGLLRVEAGEVAASRNTLRGK